MNPKIEGPAPPGNRPESPAAAKPLDDPSLPSVIPGYAVVMITRHGMPRRKVYLDLGHARAAVARSRGKGLHAELILCRLTAVTTDLDLDGEWSE